jgi:lycopene cyclase domain-containing protein
VFLAWDALAIRAGQWSYRHLSGLAVGDLPIEEILFFCVVPVAALLTVEAVRRVRPDWWRDDR